jgi:hypothetical protein
MPQLLPTMAGKLQFSGDVPGCAGVGPVDIITKNAQNTAFFQL